MLLVGDLISNILYTEGLHETGDLKERFGQCASQTVITLTEYLT
jgi:hypothetical protein